MNSTEFCRLVDELDLLEVIDRKIRKRLAKMEKAGDSRSHRLESQCLQFQAEKMMPVWSKVHKTLRYIDH